MKKKEYTTIPELAKLLGISRIAVYKQVKRGKIAAHKIGRNYVVSDRAVRSIVGREMTPKAKRRVDDAVKRVVREYGEVLRRLGKE